MTERRAAWQDEGMKTCRGCGVEKPVADFPRQSAKRGRRPQARCQDCVNAYKRATRHSPQRQAARARELERGREHREANRDALNARKREWNARNRERISAANKAWREAHPERAAELSRQWRERNPEQVAESRRRSREDDPEHAAALMRRRVLRRRARLREAFVEDVDPQTLYAMHGGCCGVCKQYVAPDDFHVDHIIPVARGGLHSYANTQPAHPFCNRSKGARLPVGYVSKATG